MNLAFVPLHISFLGIESYALVGFFAMLQSWLLILDFGLTPTLNREMAKFKGGGHTVLSIQTLLRTTEFLSLGIALIVILLLWFLAPLVPLYWIQNSNLSDYTIVNAIRIMGCVIGLRFLEGIYRACLIGLQFQLVLNVMTSTITTLRSLGVVVILWTVQNSIEAFFIWQGFVSLLSVAMFKFYTDAILPKPEVKPRFLISSVSHMALFASGMFVSTCLSLLLTNVDKIILSRLLSLEEFGYYSFAALLAGSVGLLGSPINQAIFPRLCELRERKDDDGFKNLYHTAAQLVTVAVGPLCINMAFFSGVVLQAWTGDAKLAASASLMVSLLTIGNLFNSIMWTPYQAQLSHGWTRLSNTGNVVAVVFLVPAIVFFTGKYGAIGAACVWIVLNFCYVLFVANLMFSKILTTERFNWYWNDIIVPLSVVIVVAGISHWCYSFHHSRNNGANGLMFFFISTTLSTLLSCLTIPMFRRFIGAVVASKWGVV